MNRDTIKMLAMATMLVNHISHLFIVYTVLLPKCVYNKKGMQLRNRRIP